MSTQNTFLWITDSQALPRKWPFPPWNCRARSLECQAGVRPQHRGEGNQDRESQQQEDESFPEEVADRCLPRGQCQWHHDEFAGVVGNSTEFPVDELI